MIIALEGIDACGKDTLAALLAARFKRSLRPPQEVLTLNFPDDDTASGALARRILTGAHPIDAERRAVALQLAQIGSRWERLRLLEKHATTGTATVLLLARYTLSSEVYGAADGVDPALTRALLTPLPAASFTFVLDVPVAESLRRRPARRDYYETNAKFLDEIRRRYVASVDSSKHIYLLDGTQTPDDLAHAICRTIIES